jgi:hypothetical protein
MCNAVTFRSNIADFWREAGDQLPFIIKGLPFIIKGLPFMIKED